MKFGPEFYIPILKIKRGEKAALSDLKPEVRAHVLPLLEVIERRGQNGKAPPPLEAHIAKQFDGLGQVVALYERFFLDCREIASEGAAAAADVLARAALLATPVIPVTGINRTVDTAAVMSNRMNGIAIRLTRKEFEAGKITRGLPAFMKRHALEPEDTDLIVDLGNVDTMIAAGVTSLAAAFLDDVPDRPRWRTLIVSGCGFPESMGFVQARSYDLADRVEWIAWRDGLFQRRSRLDRLPIFSDCGIQHSRGVEGIDFRKVSASASIRITQTDQWLLVKGVRESDVPLRTQFPELAKRLVYGDLKTFFAGVDHCAGCSRMVDAANRRRRLITREVWRKLGTIHHITCAVESISALTSI